MSHSTKAARRLRVIVTAVLGAAGCGESATAPDLSTVNLLGVVYATQPLDQDPGVVWVRVVARSDLPISPPDSVGVRIWDHTELFIRRPGGNMEPASISAIRADDMLRVWHDDNILLSAPPQV